MTSSALSVPASSSSPQPSVQSANSSDAVDSSHASSSVVSARRPVDVVTEQLAGLQLSSGGLRQRRRNGQDVQDAQLSHDRRPHAGDRDRHQD